MKKRSHSNWGLTATGILLLAVSTVGGFAALVLCGAAAESGSPASSSVGIPVTFTDVTKASGITFKQDSTQTEEKYYLETMGTGVAWLDYGQDGLMIFSLCNQPQRTFTRRRIPYAAPFTAITATEHLPMSPQKPV